MAEDLHERSAGTGDQRDPSPHSCGGAFPDWRSALMLVAARLRHTVGTGWGTRKYLEMGRLKGEQSSRRFVCNSIRKPNSRPIRQQHCLIGLNQSGLQQPPLGVVM